MPPSDPDTTADPAPPPQTDHNPSTDSRTSVNLAPRPDDAPVLDGSRYRVVGPHAKGGLGAIFRAEDLELGRPLALKTIQIDRDDGDSRSRILREAEITARLEHPGVVPVHGLLRAADGRPVYAMRFVAGRTLQDAIERFHGSRPRRYDGLAFRQLLGRFVSVCQTMAFAHGKGVIHRDLKPSNIMIGEFGETLVVDWGLAKEIADCKLQIANLKTSESGAGSEIRNSQSEICNLTLDGHALGTPQYMSPEQAAGNWAAITPASDVFGLGATLYCILTGRPPWPWSEWPRMKPRIEAGDFLPPTAIVRSVPRGLEAVCQKAMALRPIDRYAGAVELAAEVERWLADEPVTARPDPWFDRLGRFAKRNRTAVAAAGVGAVALAIGLSVYTSGRQREAYLREVAAARTAEATQKKRLAREVFDALLSESTLAVLSAQPVLQPAQAEFLRAALPFYEEIARDEPTTDAERRMLAEAGLRAGFVLERLGRRADAATAYERAVREFTHLAGADAKMMVRLGDARSRLAGVWCDLNRPAEAEALVTAAVADLRPLTADGPDARRVLARALNRQAILAAATGRGHAAEAAYREGIAVLQPLSGPPAVLERVELQLNLAIVLRQHGQPAEAEALYREAIAAVDAPEVRDPRTPKLLGNSARARSGLGSLLRHTPRASEAAVYLRSARADWERLAGEFPSVAMYQHELARADGNLGNWLSENGDRSEAIDAYRRALAAFDRLTALAPGVTGYVYEAAMVRGQLGNALDEADRPAEAEAELRAAVDALEKLTAQAPAMIEAATGLGGAYLNYALYLRDRGRPADCLEWYDRSLVTLAAARKNGAAATAAAFTANAHRGRATALAMLDRPADALADWDAAIGVSAPDRRPKLELLRAVSRSRVGHIAEALAAVEQYADADVVIAARAVARAAEQRPELAGRAVELLKRAAKVDGKWKDDPDFMALRNDAGFQALFMK